MQVMYNVNTAQDYGASTAGTITLSLVPHLPTHCYFHTILLHKKTHTFSLAQLCHRRQKMQEQSVNYLFTSCYLVLTFNNVFHDKNSMNSHRLQDGELHVRDFICGTTTEELLILRPQLLVFDRELYSAPESKEL